MEYSALINCDPSRLLALELADAPRARAFGINPNNGSAKIEERLQLLRQVYAEYSQKLEQMGLKEPITHLWHLWLPLALSLAQTRQQLHRPLVQGILGVQGTGKTTLCKVLTLILLHLGYQTLAISLDDLYKTYGDRQNLLKTSPLLIWRGPPGTHDLGLGLELLEQVRQNQSPILVPQFDKSLYGGQGDRVAAKVVSRVDILLFEGWFVGVRPSPQNFADPLTKESNERLKDYLPLWEKIDRLMVLLPVDYRLSKDWRTAAEQKMRQAGKSGMSDAEVERFVEYFWRSLPPDIFIAPLIKNPELVDLVVEINADHSVRKVYK